MHLVSIRCLENKITVTKIKNNMQTEQDKMAKQS
jgi:hypothetical protein